MKMEKGDDKYILTWAVPEEAAQGPLAWASWWHLKPGASGVPPLLREGSDKGAHLTRTIEYTYISAITLRQSFSLSVCTAINDCPFSGPLRALRGHWLWPCLANSKMFLM